MPYNPNQHRRRSIRLRGYDYSQPGAYFVTICTHDRQPLFGDMSLREIAEQQWRALNHAGLRGKYAGRMSVDTWIVMPDHVHGIIMIDDVIDDMIDDVFDDVIDDVIDDMFDNVIDNVIDDVGAQQPGSHHRAKRVLAAAPLPAPLPDVAPKSRSGGVRDMAAAAPLPDVTPKSRSGGDCDMAAATPLPDVAPKSRSGGVRGMAAAAPLPDVTRSESHMERGNRGLGINVIPGSLGAIVRSYKAAVARRVNRRRHAPGAPVWQRNYYERILRDERQLMATRRYIAENPARWAAGRDDIDTLLERMHVKE